MTHNGTFLDATFTSPNGRTSLNPNRFSLTKEKVKEYQTKWDQKSNWNAVTHNGTFEDATFTSPNGRTNSNPNRFSLTKEKVKEYQTKWDQKSKDDPNWTTVEDAVEAVVKKINLKRLVVADKVKDTAMQQLKELVGEGNKL